MFIIVFSKLILFLFHFMDLLYKCHIPSEVPIYLVLLEKQDLLVWYRRSGQPYLVGRKPFLILYGICIDNIVIFYLGFLTSQHSQSSGTRDHSQSKSRDFPGLRNFYKYNKKRSKRLFFKCGIRIGSLNEIRYFTEKSTIILSC